MKRFHRSLLLSFFITASCLVLASQLLHHRYISKLGKISLETIFREVPTRYLDPTIQVPQATKAHHEFFVSRYDYRGMGLRLLENPELFENAFPGYAEARTNSELWNKYFTLPFETDGIWLPELNRERPEKIVALSWSGCLEIYQRYGADVVMLGTSQVSRGIVPQLLQHKLSQLPHPENRPWKVLMCSRPNMAADGARVAAEALSKFPHHPKLIIWGYSIWNAGAVEDDASTVDLFERLVQGLEPRWDFSKLALHWTDLIPIDYRRVSGIFSRQPKNSPPHGLPFSEDVVIPDTNGFWVSNRAAQDPDWIDRLASKSHFSTPDYQLLRDRKCNLQSASQQMDRTLDRLRGLASQVLLFPVPMPQYFTREIEKCVLEGLEKVIASKASDSVSVLPQMATWKGLRNADFIYLQSQAPSYARFDVVHLNYAGAVKLTEAISDTAVSQLQRKLIASHRP